jgi:hypothetical protein
LAAKNDEYGKGKVGANSKYTPQIVKKIIDLVKMGNFKSPAARACGISHDTLWRWETEHPEFSEALKNAEANGEAELVKKIKKASGKNWTAAAWMLERKNHQRWGRKDKLEMSGHLLNGTPEDIEKATVEMFRSNPEAWEAIKAKVEGQR